MKNYILTLLIKNYSKFSMIIDAHDEKYAILRTLDEQQKILLKRKLKILHNELNKTQSQLGDIDEPVGVSKNDQTEQLDDIYEPIKLETKHKNQQIISVSNKSIVKLSIPIVALLLIVIMSVGMFDGNVNYQHERDPFKSKYVIENLRGDTIDTMKSWQMVEGETMNINLINGHDLTYDQYIAAVDVIVSTESIDIDDSLLMKGPKGSMSTYFLGWEGAVQEAQKQNTENVIPSDFNVIQSSDGEGDIVIDFVTYHDSDGYTGFTRSIVEDTEILKSFITIYDVDNLEPEELADILRHEFGHALGLGHSTDPEDLMAPIILTEYPYVSPCNVEALSVLYDGQEHSIAVCEK